MFHSFRPLLSALCLTCAAFSQSALPPETGRFNFRVYSPKDYLASPQNWAIAEDSRGVLYFGNTEGLLEFNGTHWRRIPLPGNVGVRSLAFDAQGTLYVGGQNEAGILGSAPNGAPAYISLLDRLDPSERKFGDVWSIVSAPEGMYLSATERLILYNPATGVRTWKTSGRFRRAFPIDGVLHVQVTGLGLHRLRGETLELAPGGSVFERLDVRGVYRSGRGNVIATSKGFFLQTSTGFEEISSPASRFVGENLLYSVAQLSGGLVALGTARGGFVLASTNGDLLRSFSKSSGLPSDYVAAIAPDRQGGVWLATGGGLARFAPRFSEFNESSGLLGALFSLKRWNNTLYAGTTSGLFRLRADPQSNDSRFEPVEPIKETVWSLLPLEDSLLVGTQRGLYEISARTSNLVSTAEVVYDLALSRRDPNLLFAAGRAGALVFQRSAGKWTKTAEISGGGEEFRTIAEDDNGVLWATTRNTIARIQRNGSSLQLRSFNATHGLPSGWKNVIRANNRLYFATESGLVKPTPDGNRFVPDPSLGSTFSDASRGILLLRDDPRGHLWISGAGYHGTLRNPGQPNAEWLPMPLLGAGLEDVWVTHTDPDGVVWAAGPDGRLVRFDPSLGAPRPPPLHVLVHRLINADTRLPIAEGLGAKLAPFRLPYEQNNLRVEVAAPFYDAPARVEYQVFLNDTPGVWTNEPFKDLNNIWEGDYRLRVRARTPLGQLSPETTLSLTITPPWFRAWYAFSAYVLLAAAAIWLIIRWRLRALRESNIRLESLVVERTAEIRRQRDQILEQDQKNEALLLNILPAPVAEELRENGSVEPMFFDDVTVCFTDFVGFTVSSESVEASDLVAKLHEYFTAFDQIVSHYGLEKLKTIGDSYMFVSGLPTPDPDHAAKAVQAALDIVAKAAEIGAASPEFSWRIRVGLHSGPVVAGVVGLKKFAFDIWGDTVNLASRMESSGVPDRVNLSSRTHAAVQDKFVCEPRGPVRTKDGRELEMFLAVRPRPAGLAQTTML